MIYTLKYGTSTDSATHIRIPIIKAGSVNFAVSADWTPASGDVKIKKDGNAVADIGTLPSATAMGNAAYWEFQFTNTELQCKRMLVMISDAATKAVEDQSFVIETFGSASAMYPADMSADTSDADARFTRAVKTNVLGTVGSGSSTTSIVTSSLDPAASSTDQFKGLIVKFAKDTTTPALRGMGTDIISSTTAGVLTVSTMSGTPQVGDTFVIL